MEMVEVKVSELSGAALDWAVAIAGAVTEVDNGLRFRRDGRPTVGGDFVIPYEPSVNWSQGGPLIEEHRISLEDIGIGWIASPRCCTTDKGSMEPQDSESLLIAACRAIVAAKLGETVSVPSEFLP
ncbi:phage protein NinX family protein [Pseudomonas sp.]|uniref:phage protein NinX family protein n=1 Tax=Pseudomonas sp. TaxID=306 RepID=UPI00258D914C|nr:phage protein NinX family protein [Pseudomonas sp.]